MREMHKWKDKVELSLDNRQIFFLFFGLSVVGCFVFALGVMTGRRLNWEPEGEVAALGDDSLQLLDENGELMGFSFKQGLEESTAEGLPETRDPAEPPRDEKEVKAEKKEAKAKAAADAKAEAKAKSAAEKAKKAAQPKLPAKKEAELAGAAAKDGTPDKMGVRIFTLQMKAFSQADEADKFADKLRRNGHDIRVEPAIVRGRTWHRVRMGTFDDWDAALAAKAEFEKSEHVIAYVVSR
jgi:hypothetical protein